MPDLSRYEFETLWAGNEFVLNRGRQRGDAASILVSAPVSMQLSPASLRRLEREYSLAAKLDPAWAVKPRALVHHDGRTMLVLDDPGGTSLLRILDQPLELRRALRIAIGTAAALRAVHRQDLVHRHVRPAAVLVDDDDRVWLTSFGMASEVPRERRQPAPPEVITGTFAYMAPEQTGRMNRSIDARSDLYSLGVVLYEMLTGALPFTASDPAEWIHCHVARQPMPPGKRRAGIPNAVEEIVLKLLAKTAEERYRTAAGVEADLRTCLAALETHGRIEPFRLAAHDASDRLLIPEKLYGREDELGALAAAFDRVVSNGTPEFVLVSGYSGVGKSSIVNELHKVLIPPRALFAAGKFDQYKRDIPYATLAQAFQGLVGQLLSKSDNELSRWKTALTGALGAQAQLIVNLIPQLALIIGEQPPVPDVPPQDAQSRFHLVFRRFLGVFARAEHPLALFLDDLQWLDAATLELLRSLATEQDVKHLLLVGAYRDNEVDALHPLMRTIEAIRDNGAHVREIVLAPLRLGDVERLLADALHCGRQVQPLAALVHEKTDGNPFFAIQFLEVLAEENLLTFDHAAAAWSWNVEGIRAKGFTENVADLMARKLGRLPERTRDALGQLACLGTVADMATLGRVSGVSDADLHAGLWDAVRAGLVLRQGGNYAFLHDRVQEAAYALIPDGERAAAHLRIGRLLVSRMPPDEMEEAIFDIANHLNRGAALIAKPDERLKVAALNLAAAQRAKRATAYASALTYLIAGQALLPEARWDQNYSLAFTLELERAECEFLTNDPAAEQRLSMLADRARDLADIAAVARLRQILYTTLNRLDRAVEVGLDYLRKVGVTWTAHPSEEDVAAEYDQLRRQLAQRPIAELAEQPLMSDPDCCATVEVLTEFVPAAYFTDINLVCLVVCRIANLSLIHGNSNGGCYAYSLLGFLLRTRFGDHEAGFRVGQLALELADERGLSRFRARVYLNFAYCVNPWTRHIRTGRDLLRRGLSAAYESGDLTFAAYLWYCLMTDLLASGDPLDQAQRECERGLEFANRARFGLVVDILTGHFRLIRALRGATAGVGSFNDAEFDEKAFEQHLEADPRLSNPTCVYWIRKMQACFHAGDYPSAVAAAAKAEPLLWTSPASFEGADYHFYAGLARAAHHDIAVGTDRDRDREALAAHHKQTAAWAQKCVENFESRAALLAAEIARIEGRDLEAMRLYEEAIRSARKHGFVQNEGLANELAARFSAARSLETAADAYLRNARSCYLRWGADGKVRQLDDAHPHLQAASPASISDSTSGTPLERLDLATVVKVSQALSSEIDLEKLIDVLMTTALEHAGADRGLLVFSRGASLWIEAEATVSGESVGVRRRDAAVAGSELPESVLHYVFRTRESLLLDDAAEQDPFARDEYIRQTRCRSILCLPLTKQSQMVGALYLENKRASRVFTPGRISLVRLLASQAAISLENAHLYTNLRLAEAYLAEAQRLSHTGSFGWSVASGEIVWSDETFRIFELDRSVKPTLPVIFERIHPDDASLVQRFIDRASHESENWDFEHRLLLPGGTIKHLHIVARPEEAEAGQHFVGAVMDITASKRAQEALQAAQAELAHVNRIMTLGELASSIAHEVRQPLAAIGANGNASLRWLNRSPIEVDEVRRALQSILDDVRRANDVIQRVGSLSRKIMPERTEVSLNDIINETVVLVQGEIRSHQVALQRELAPDLPLVHGDRIQLQQVLINVVINGIQAMAAVDDRPRVLLIRSKRRDSNQVLIQVEDTGNGIDPEQRNRLFDPFFTTKPNGMGIGLSICRSIIDAHGGEIWSDHGRAGAVFQFSLPSTLSEASNSSRAEGQRSVVAAQETQ